MFKELAPLLQQRSVVIMVNPLEGETLRVIVMPKRLNDSENAALSTPVSVSGTPAEIDEQLPTTLTQFVGAHLDLKNTLELAKEEMAQAARTARQDAKAKTTNKTDAAAPAKTATAKPKPGDSTAKPAEPKKLPPPMTGNLFDFGGAQTPAPAPVATSTPAPADVPAEASDEGASEEEEIMAEISEDDQTGEELDAAA